jgi:hypothetical protein
MRKGVFLILGLTILLIPAFVYTHETSAERAYKQDLSTMKVTGLKLTPN